VILFGGRDASSSPYLGDTWQWDGNAWTQVSTTGPSPRAEVAMAGLDGGVVLFGGWDGTTMPGPFGSQVPEYFGDTWQWNGHAWIAWTPVGPAPAPRGGHAMATFGGGVVLYGGDVGGNFADTTTWGWNGTAWTVLGGSDAGLPTSMGPSTGLAMASQASTLLQYGGASWSGTWLWDGTEWSLQGYAGPRTPISGHAMATLGSRVFLFGGTVEYTVSGLSSDTFDWDGMNWNWHNVSGPSARTGHAMAPIGGKIVLFGGWDGITPLSDTWEWDGSAWTQVCVAGPSARYDHAMASP
jgi:hypothetical protein